jgi:hypothetical protein
MGWNALQQQQHRRGDGVGSLSCHHAPSGVTPLPTHPAGSLSSAEPPLPPRTQRGHSHQLNHPCHHAPSGVTLISSDEHADSRQREGGRFDRDSKHGDEWRVHCGPGGELRAEHKGDACVSQ